MRSAVLLQAHADALHKLGVEGIGERLFRNLLLLLWLGAVLPAIGQALGGVDDALAVFAPPVDTSS